MEEAGDDAAFVTQALGNIASRTDAGFRKRTTVSSLTARFPTAGNVNA
jgi:hypothetical protein